MQKWANTIAFYTLMLSILIPRRTTTVEMTSSYTGNFFSNGYIWDDWFLENFFLDSICYPGGYVLGLTCDINIWCIFGFKICLLNVFSIFYLVNTVYFVNKALECIWVFCKIVINLTPNLLTTNLRTYDFRFPLCTLLLLFCNMLKQAFYVIVKFVRFHNHCERYFVGEF